MLGNYDIKNGQLVYLGNRILPPLGKISQANYTPQKHPTKISSLSNDKHYFHLHNIDNAVFDASVDYFRNLGAAWCNLPLTTKMISSPGEIYAGEKLDYTTDALPVKLKWFDDSEIFLSESSQFYLELRLIIDKIDQVYSIYNSFRKERADFSHLSEFQHIEYEGKIDFNENIKIYTGLLRYITNFLIKNNYSDLSYYLYDEEIEELKNTFDEQNIAQLTFIEVMDILYLNLKNKKYKEISLKNFGAFEEVALTRIVGKHCNVKEYPLEEVPFYHEKAFADNTGKKFAKNSDFILCGYREVIGAGKRILDEETIIKKAEHFNLPKEDYEPYIKLRSLPNYQSTCGFGMGWQRYTQWLLKMPYIWHLSHFPRSEHLPHP